MVLRFSENQIRGVDLPVSMGCRTNHSDTSPQHRNTPLTTPLLGTSQCLLRPESSISSLPFVYAKPMIDRPLRLSKRAELKM